MDLYSLLFSRLMTGVYSCVLIAVVHVYMRVAISPIADLWLDVFFHHRSNYEYSCTLQVHTLFYSIHLGSVGRQTDEIHVQSQQQPFIDSLFF